MKTEGLKSSGIILSKEMETMSYREITLGRVAHAL